MPRLGSKDLPRLMRCRELEFEFRSWIRVFIGGIGGILVIPTELGLEEEEGEGEGGGGFGRSRGRATFSTISIFCVCVCVSEREPATNLTTLPLHGVLDISYFHIQTLFIKLIILFILAPPHFFFTPSCFFK